MILVQLLLLVFCNYVVAIGGFAISTPRGGGRASTTPDMPSLNDDDDTDEAFSTSVGKRWYPKPPSSPSEARLTLVQITDVYTLENFASIKTMLKETRNALKKYGLVSCASVLTGDFLAPYLLSSVDRGDGMMNAIIKTPIDFLTWGNHEADIDHRTVCEHVKNYHDAGGVWINSNMQDHDAMEYQKPFDIIDICSPDGTNKRRIGLVAVLSNDPGLYGQFKDPGAFGGAHIDDPWDVLKNYKELLEGPQYNCDVVIPLQHTYVPDDHKTCKQFDFPVVLSGHDHHRVDEVVDGCRLLKPGLDAIYATVLEVSWCDAAAVKNKPAIRARFVKCDQWEPDPELEEENIRAYDSLSPLRNTELARVPPNFEPLSSSNSRGKVCTMGRFICSLLRSSLNTRRRQRQHNVDAVILMGGNIRGGTDYELGSYFSLEALEAEIKSDEVVAVVPIPGGVLADGIAATHSGEPIPGWMQYDDGVYEEYKEDGTPIITHVGGQPIDRNKIYRVGTKISDLTNGQSKPLTEYFQKHPEMLPPKGAYVNVHSELMSFFAKNIWRKIWEAISPKYKESSASDDEETYTPSSWDVLCGPDQCDPEGRLSALDKDDTGFVSVDEIHDALRDLVGLSIDKNEKSLAKFVHRYADTTGTGQVTLEDFENFCYEEMPYIYENQKWRLQYARTSAQATTIPKTAANTSYS